MRWKRRIAVKEFINGTDIYYEFDDNSGEKIDPANTSKVTLIALHGGLGFDHGYLKPGIGALRDVARILYIDLRGQGKSGRPSLSTCSLEQMADDVADLFKSLGIKRPILFGHSAGGFVAMHLALQYQELIGGLILSGTVPSLSPPVEEDGEPSPTLASRADSDVLAVAKRYFGNEVTHETATEFFRHVGPFYAAPAHMQMIPHLLSLSSVEISMLRHFRKTIVPNYDLRPMLEHIKCETLVLVGHFDWVCPPKASRAIAHALPKAKLVEFANSGHFLFSEEPERFKSVVTEFVESIAGVGVTQASDSLTNPETSDRIR